MLRLHLPTPVFRFPIPAWMATLAALIPSVGGAKDLPTPVDFNRNVFAVLQRSCFECHGPDRQEASLRLDSESKLIDSGVVESGDPESSELIRRITLPRNHDEVMPVVGDPLTESEVAGLESWILEGARWPVDFTPPKHWSYETPVRPMLPPVSDTQWAKQPIDRFVLSRLDSLGLAPSPPAEDAVLLRRVYLDLIGLPPTLEEIEAFEADASDHAIERVVDDLLTRPQFGERWARPWLDLARYADSHGFQRDDFRDTWAYRDWVIQALNDDMPFDQFTVEQLAGDLLPNSTESQKIATGFHRCAPTNVEAGSLPEETRSEQVIDRVNTTASVWLGSTLECAQCHDHKFDQFTIKEYYQFLAFFNNTPLEADLKNPKTPSSIGFIGPSMNLSNPDRDQERQELVRTRQRLAGKLKTRRDQLSEDLADWVKKLQPSIDNSPQTFPLKITDFQSLGNTDTYEIRDDDSVLLVGNDPPSTDTYTVTVTLSDSFSEIPRTTAIRLDVLTDESLPGTGPGRGDPERNNFVLNEFKASLVTAEGTRQSLKLSDAQADFSQKKYDAGNAIDGDAKTGWAIAPQFSRPHHATFSLAEPLDFSSATRIEFELQQNYGGARTIGCFRLSAMTGDLGQQTIPAAIVALASKPSAKWSGKDRKALLAHRSLFDATMLAVQKQLDAIDEDIKALAPDTTQVMVETKDRRTTHVFERGDYRSPGELVQPGTPECLPPMQSDGTSDSPRSRLDLARWLTDPANPLVSRVTVNRWWMELFGEGLVRTPEDFGIKGDRPTHPDLLDWLAVEFVEKGWTMKHVLKTIVMSATYQQSSDTNEAILEFDDQNRFLARGPRVRMDAEMIRDNALAVSGLISLKQFGPPIRPYQPDGLWKKVGGQSYPYVVSPGDESHRRGVYVVIKRGSPYPSFTNFDASNRFSCTVQRSRSNTPLQALTLLNDPVYIEVAKTMAIRAAKQAQTESVQATIMDEFRRSVSRRPNAAEIGVLGTLFEEQSQKLQRDPSSAERLAEGVRLPKNITKRDFAAWFSITTVLLNLHETITKE